MWYTSVGVEIVWLQILLLSTQRFRESTFAALPSNVLRSLRLCVVRLNVSHTHTLTHTFLDYCLDKERGEEGRGDGVCWSGSGVIGHKRSESGRDRCYEGKLRSDQTRQRDAEYTVWKEDWWGCREEEEGSEGVPEGKDVEKKNSTRRKEPEKTKWRTLSLLVRWRKCRNRGCMWGSSSSERSGPRQGHMYTLMLTHTHAEARMFIRTQMNEDKLWERTELLLAGHFCESLCVRCHLCVDCPCVLAQRFHTSSNLLKFTLLYELQGFIVNFWSSFYLLLWLQNWKLLVLWAIFEPVKPR